MPFSWASSSASAICFAIATASSTGIGPRFEPLGEVLALDELHDEDVGLRPVRERDAVEAVEVGDAGVVERGEQLRLALEAREPIGVGSEGLGQQLQRDIAPELRVGRAVHLAHAAGADRGRDPVVGEGASWSQGQAAAVYRRDERATSSGGTGIESPVRQRGRDVPATACRKDAPPRRARRRPDPGGEQCRAGLRRAGLRREGRRPDRRHRGHQRGHRGRRRRPAAAPCTCPRVPTRASRST